MCGGVEAGFGLRVSLELCVSLGEAGAATLLCRLSKAPPYRTSHSEYFSHLCSFSSAAQTALLLIELENVQVNRLC